MRQLLLAFVACAGSLDLHAQAGDPKSTNPPRSQQDIMRERRVACHDLKGAEFRECVNNYVGTRPEPKDADATARPQDPKSPPDPQTPPSAPAKPEPKK